MFESLESKAVWPKIGTVKAFIATQESLSNGNTQT